MIASVAGEYHWAPNIIGALFIDDKDHYGLEYWEKIVVKNTKELNEFIQSLKDK